MFCKSMFLQIHILQIHLLKIHVLQIRVLQIHLLQIQSTFTNPIQSFFYNMPSSLTCDYVISDDSGAPKARARGAP